MERKSSADESEQPAADVQRAIAAYHEAGHVVAHVERGGTVDFVEIAARDDGWAGRTRSDPLPSFNAPRSARRPVVIALYAGRAAADIYEPKWHMWNAEGAGFDAAGGDDDKAGLLLDGLGEDDMRRAATRLMTARWPRVQAIAERLIIEERIGEQVILDLMRENPI